MRTPRIPLLTALAALALLVAVQPVAAINEVSDTGNTGNWIANDSDTTPGGKCEYSDTFRLRRISARPPVVFSFRPAGQQVKWRIKIVKSRKVSEPNNYADETVYVSPYQKKFATLSQPAAFTRKAWLREGSLADSSIRFKLWVIVKWLKPDGKPEGTVAYRYSWFRQVGGGVDKTGEDFYCYRAPF